MPDSVPQVVIIAGPNGAGKSTAAPDLLQGALAVDDFINADQISLGLSGFDPRGAAREAGRIMLRRMDELAGEGRSFAFESTLAGLALTRRIDRFLLHGYAVRIAYLWLDDPDLAVERVKQRARSGGHDVPEQDVRRRFWRSARNFDRRYAPRATSWRLYDGSVPSIPTVAYRSEGEEITIIGTDRWQAFQAFARLAWQKGGS